MIKLKNILNEGIINQDRINLFIKDVEQELKTNLTPENIWSLKIESIINYTLNKHFGLKKIISKIYLHPLKMDFLGHSLTFDGGKINHGKKYNSFDVLTATGYYNTQSDEQKQYRDFINYALKDLLLILQHELTHYEQNEITNDTEKSSRGYDQDNTKSEEYYYHHLEIDTFSIEFARALYNNNIKPEDLKGDLKNVVLKIVQKYNSLRFDLAKFYTKFDKPQARKFWKYVYLHLIELYKIK